MNKTNDVFYSLAVVIIFGLLFTGCASEEQITYRNQFNNNIAYNRWDLNTDGVLNREELYSNIYKIVDINDNTYLSNAEWRNAIYFFSTYRSDDYGNFKNWDSDSNKQIDKNEFTECFSSSKLFEAWDTDKNKELNNAELTNGLFDVWDINDDATLSSYEARNWRDAAI